MDKKVLWVEDDYYHIQFLFQHLAKEGMTVTPALSAFDAYQAIEHGAKFDLMIVDIILPISSTLEKLPTAMAKWEDEKYPGVALIKWLKTEKKVKCPVVILSVIDEPISEFGLQDLEISDSIHKKRLGPSAFAERILKLL